MDGVASVRAGKVCAGVREWLHRPTYASLSAGRRTTKLTPGLRLVSYASPEGPSTAAPGQPSLQSTDATSASEKQFDNLPPPPVGSTTLEDVPPPGQDDDTWFEQHWSVQYWRSRGYTEQEEVPDLQELAAIAAQSARQANVLQDPTSAAYWAYHTARWAFFSAQGGASVVLTAARSGGLSKEQLAFIRGPLNANNSTALAWNTASEVFGAFECDLRNVKEGAYKLPWDMTTPGHRQLSPLHVLRQSLVYLQEAQRALGRGRDPERSVGLLPFERSPLYPGYYQNNFHFQTDGWFSSQSAEVYDFETEALFAGRQDAMQRGTLLALDWHFPGSNGAGLDMLEVGAGTGRVATFVRDNYPAARLTVSDLSPFYLQKAASTMAYWERSASPSARSAGSTAFVQCAAEALPQAEASLDAVYSVYMFHEMPTDARRAALREFARVLKPGGVLVITDSAQEGDRQALRTLKVFEGFNEPHFVSYVDFSFGTELAAVGLKPCFKSLSSLTKTLSAVKR